MVEPVARGFYPRLSSNESPDTGAIVSMGWQNLQEKLQELEEQLSMKCESGHIGPSHKAVVVHGNRPAPSWININIQKQS